MNIYAHFFGKYNDCYFSLAKVLNQLLMWSSCEHIVNYSCLVQWGTIESLGSPLPCNMNISFPTYSLVSIDNCSVPLKFRRVSITMCGTVNRIRIARLNGQMFTSLPQFPAKCVNSRCQIVRKSSKDYPVYLQSTSLPLWGMSPLH